MNIKQAKTYVLAVLFFLIDCLSVHAQFNTLWSKDKVQAMETDRIIEETRQNMESGIPIQMQEVDAIHINENEKYILNGMNRSKNLALPIDDMKVNSMYGYRTDPFTGKRTFHKGIDLDADFNYIYSIMPGKVIKSGKNRTFGEFIQVEHGEFVTTYAHLFQRLVSAKEAVEAGQPIGVSGSTGRSTGEHLHFQMSYDGKSIDPLPILNYIQQIMQEARKEIENAINQLNINQ